MLLAAEVVSGADALRIGLVNRAGALPEALMSPMGAPMADIRQVKFVGAAAKAGRVLAGYIVTGKDLSGTDAIVGFVLDLENGQIVGVN